MNGWTVDLTGIARRDLRKLEEGPQQAAIELLQDLNEGPELGGAIELRSNPDVWRVRFHSDQYRMLYQVSRKRNRILVTRIRPRSTAYKGMKT